jgi:predicted nucleic acid-binding protein
MMAWVVDTCLLIDIAEADAEFGQASAAFLEAKASDGLVLCPVTYVELAPVFEGDPSLLNEFLDGAGIGRIEQWTQLDTHHAHQGWWRYVRAKRASRIGKRLVADILIGAFAMRFQGLLTRNISDFRVHFPALSIKQPVPTKREHR